MDGVNGAPTRTRTADLLITNQLLYQLSYRGTGRPFNPNTKITQDPFMILLQVLQLWYKRIYAKDNKQAADNEISVTCGRAFY